MAAAHDKALLLLGQSAQDFHGPTVYELQGRAAGDGDREAGDLTAPYLRYLDILPSQPWHSPLGTCLGLSHGDQGEEGCVTQPCTVMSLAGRQPPHQPLGDGLMIRLKSWREAEKPGRAPEIFAKVLKWINTVSVSLAVYYWYHLILLSAFFGPSSVNSCQATLNTITVRGQIKLNCIYWTGSNCSLARAQIKTKRILVTINRLGIGICNSLGWTLSHY